MLRFNMWRPGTATDVLHCIEIIHASVSARTHPHPYRRSGPMLFPRTTVRFDRRATLTYLTTDATRRSRGSFPFLSLKLYPRGLLVRGEQYSGRVKRVLELCRHQLSSLRFRSFVRNGSRLKYMRICWSQLLLQFKLCKGSIGMAPALYTHPTSPRILSSASFPPSVCASSDQLFRATTTLRRTPRRPFHSASQ